MRPDVQLAIATAPRKDSKTWKQGDITWEALVDWMGTPDDHKECGNYVLGTLSGPQRSKTTIVSRGALTLDADSAAPDMWDRLAGQEWASLAHTTFQSTPDAQRMRIIIPLSREVAPDEYYQLATVVMVLLGEAQFDPGSVQAERFMYRPSAERPEWFRWQEVDGEPADADALLAGWDPDLSTLPAPKVNVTKRNPFEVAGVVGAFNRAYSIEAAIEEYELPYEPDGDRWHLVGARAVAGMSIIAEGLAFSHHVTDPAWGRACSAFDLVRLHRFGILDEEKSDKTPVNKLPSHIAMLELASTDANVVAEIVGHDFVDEMDAAHEWKLRLRLHARTGSFVDCVENWDLLRENEPVLKALHWNELTLSVESSVDLPWRSLDQGGATFGEADRANLTQYIERVYHVRPARGLVNDLVLMAAWQRFVNPLRDYLTGLSWDGESRIEECLPGVEPTPYTRLVARKCMVAAVARVLDPGCKWDHTLVLYGNEGLGKSWWVERVSRGYSATLGRIGDKDTLLVMQRSWIMVSDEGYSLRKADADVQKEFLTRTEDVFRLPYDRESQAHPRHCVIWGTTNDDTFLRRQEGNRRFLIVHCEQKVDFDQLTDEYVGQLWAEAVALYTAGEPLWLDDQESLRAADERERFVEEDALAGVIMNYLDTPVPADWDDRSAESRREWMQMRDEGMVQGTQPITRTCTAQIWVEVMGKRFGDHSRVQLLEIAAVLKRLPGWHPLPGRHRMPLYGPQLVYERDADVLALYSELL